MALQPTSPTHQYDPDARRGICTSGATHLFVNGAWGRFGDFVSQRTFGRFGFEVRFLNAWARLVAVDAVRPTPTPIPIVGPARAAGRGLTEIPRGDFGRIIRTIGGRRFGHVVDRDQAPDRMVWRLTYSPGARRVPGGVVLGEPSGVPVGLFYGADWERFGAQDDGDDVTIDLRIEKQRLLELGDTELSLDPVVEATTDEQQMTYRRIVSGNDEAAWNSAREHVTGGEALTNYGCEGRLRAGPQFWVRRTSYRFVYPDPKPELSEGILYMTQTVIGDWTGASGDPEKPYAINCTTRASSYSGGMQNYKANYRNIFDAYDTDGADAIEAYGHSEPPPYAQVRWNVTDWWNNDGSNNALNVGLAIWRDVEDQRPSTAADIILVYGSEIHGYATIEYTVAPAVATGIFTNPWGNPHEAEPWR
jgi:hypothetical protein